MSAIETRSSSKNKKNNSGNSGKSSAPFGPPRERTNKYMSEDEVEEDDSIEQVLPTQDESSEVELRQQQNNNATDSQEREEDVFNNMNVKEQMNVMNGFMKDMQHTCNVLLRTLQRQESRLDTLERDAINSPAKSAKNSSNDSPSSGFQRRKSIADVPRRGIQNIHWTSLFDKSEQEVRDYSSPTSSRQPLVSSVEEQSAYTNVQSPTQNATQASSNVNLGSRLFKDIHDSENTPKNQVMYVRNVKECSVKIHEFRLSKVSKAIKDIIDYQQEEDTKVKVIKVLSPQMRQHLATMYQVTSTDLGQMGLDQLFGIIAQETQVNSIIQFYTELKEALSHINYVSYTHSDIHQFNKFYYQQLMVIDEFKRSLKIMLVSNLKHCPPVNDKEWGLIRLFKSLGGYGWYIRNRFAGQNLNHFQTMDEFFEEYKAKLVDDFAIVKLTKGFEDKDTRSSTDRERKYFSRKNEIFKGGKRKEAPMNKLFNINQSEESSA